MSDQLGEHTPADYAECDRVFARLKAERDDYKGAMKKMIEAHRQMQAQRNIAVAALREINQLPLTLGAYRGCKIAGDALYRIGAIVLLDPKAPNT